MRKTALGCTILEGHDIADLPLVSENSEILEAEINKKVDKVSGKGLSTNDYTTSEKNKLAGIETGANKYVHPNTHPATMITTSDGKNVETKLNEIQDNGGKVDTVNGIKPDSNKNIQLSAANIGAATPADINTHANKKDVHGLKEHSIALLANSQATGENAIAIGQAAKAGGDYSIALGTGAKANISDSIAIGFFAEANNKGEGILGTSGYTSKWIVPGSFTVKGTKNFEIPHPNPAKKATHMLRHAAVESPTAGDTLYRYAVEATKDNDLVTIDLPDYFIWLNKDVQIFVTPQGHFGNGYGVLNREIEQLEIHCQYEGEYNVLVIGTRNDDHPSVQDWDIKGAEREIGESWTGETYAFEVDEYFEFSEIKEEGILL